MRICGDYRLTVNYAAKPNTYPLPRIDDIFASLSGDKTFSKLDLANAYQQIPLEQKSKQVLPENQRPSLSPAKVKLRTYKSEHIPVLGVATINVNQCKMLELLVAV